MFDAATGGWQSYGPSINTLFCNFLPPDPSHASMFDDLNADFHGWSDWNVQHNNAVIRFDWAVNVWEAKDLYHARAALHGGQCDTDSLVGSPAGFHVQSGDPSGWLYWTVLASETCDYNGCRCTASWGGYVDAGGNIDFGPTWCVNDNSRYYIYEGQECLDSRFSDIVEVNPGSCPTPLP